MSGIGYHSEAIDELDRIVDWFRDEIVKCAEEHAENDMSAITVERVRDAATQLFTVGLTDGLSGGRAAHQEWERTRSDENECDAEKRIREEVSENGDTIPTEWWHGWLERSDDWRDEIENAA